MKRVRIIGGVAAGASCAARLRRLDEEADIVVFERGPYPSFASCGLPYYIGGVISEEEKLLVATPELFRSRFGIDVRTEQEALRIDRERKTVEVKELASGRVYEEPYDALVLAPGAAPVRPALPGIGLGGIFAVRTIPDSRAIRQWIERTGAKRAVVAGGGYIGLEMAENLAARGLNVTVVEMANQLMTPLDHEMAGYVYVHLLDNRVSVRLEEAVAGFEGADGRVARVLTAAGVKLDTDLVILALGVRPETKLAREAGLAIGPRGGICVDESMRTSDPAIWAAGDAVEVRDCVTGDSCLAPLAGPANRQGRAAADAICGREAPFRGVEATAVCGVFGLTVAMTGASEKRLIEAGYKDYEAVYLHEGHHAGYYPGAKRMHLKLLFRKPDGLILGAQAVGKEGVERRIDIISFGIQRRSTVFDLEEAELCYAPQYGSAKDVVNMAGMVAANVLRGDMKLARWSDLPGTNALLVDVRDADEFRRGGIDGAINLPLPELRARLDELPRDREIWVSCAVGQRAYYAARCLEQHGFKVRNLSGGYITWEAYYPEGTPDA
jgi:NADPH-dependent 2,4-dienoyl-CoA reductase/sulfur reductase-like enzyme/rhodanese-related sulfurtransferase